MNDEINEERKIKLLITNCIQTGTIQTTVLNNGRIALTVEGDSYTASERRCFWTIDDIHGGQTIAVVALDSLTVEDIYNLIMKDIEKYHSENFDDLIELGMPFKEINKRMKGR